MNESYLWDVQAQVPPKVIFASHAVGAAILPLMLFHQTQLMVCAALAQRWSRHAEPSPSQASAGAKSLLPH
jgi:sodium/bile acid cotransporter 7